MKQGECEGQIPCGQQAQVDNKLPPTQLKTAPDMCCCPCCAACLSWRLCGFAGKWLEEDVEEEEE